MILISVSPAAAQDKTILIDKGVPAKFSGVLMPMYQFKAMNEELVEKDLIKKEVIMEPAHDRTDVITSFCIGFVAGSMTIYLADKLGSR